MEYLKKSILHTEQRVTSDCHARTKKYKSVVEKDYSMNRIDGRIANGISSVIRERIRFLRRIDS